MFLAEDLGFYAEGQGQNQVRGQIVPKNVAHKLLKQIQWNFTEREVTRKYV